MFVCDVDDEYHGCDDNDGNMIAGIDSDVDGEWKVVRVTLDSGATIDIMPEDKLRHVPITPCTGTRRGRNLVAANNTPIAAKGEKKSEAVTAEGIEIDWSFIAGDVKKMLKSIATTCDDDYWVVFKKDGGWIIDTSTKQRTAFQRVGNSYVLDVWVFVPS